MSSPVAPSSVLVVGTGSLGLAFAAALAARGHRVTLLGRAGSASRLLGAGSISVRGGLELDVEVVPEGPLPGQLEVADDPSLLRPARFVLFTTKGRDLPGAAASVAGSAVLGASGNDGVTVAGLQNGVLKDEVLAGAFGAERVLGAATVLGARRLKDGEVLVAGVGVTYLGELGAAPSPRARYLAEALGDAGITCEVVVDARSMLWSKYANAVGIFAVSVLTGLPTAQLLSRRPLVRAYHSLLHEVAAVARAEGVELSDHRDLTMRSYLESDPDDLAAVLASRLAALDAPPSWSSMAQDVAAGRQTEAEQIFGDLVARGRRHGIDTPCAELVYELVSGIDLGVAGSRGAGPAAV